IHPVFIAFVIYQPLSHRKKGGQDHISAIIKPENNIGKTAGKNGTDKQKFSDFLNEKYSRHKKTGT
ncbi:MAG: hypothetical protein OEX19_09785, partial [Gammaproteobacteria bacterium]|nr:hypothetical protein [Gammaproteobacteria bacterium]